MPGRNSLNLFLFRAMVGSRDSGGTLMTCIRRRSGTLRFAIWCGVANGLFVSCACGAASAAVRHARVEKEAACVTLAVPASPVPVRAAENVVLVYEG